MNRDLVARDGQGKIYTVRYEAVNAMLLNEFLKEHKKIRNKVDPDSRAKKTRSASCKKGMASVVAKLQKQASQIEKVTAHLEFV